VLPFTAAQTEELFPDLKDKSIKVPNEHKRRIELALGVEYEDAKELFTGPFITT
jgi:hypothetical protein